MIIGMKIIIIIIKLCTRNMQKMCSLISLDMNYQTNKKK